MVLRCEQCNKPFDKESTLKRHGYYCRSRNVGTGRSRSCIGCVRRKARCDTKRPKCSRCISKDIECHYPASAPKRESLIQHGDLAINRQDMAPLSVTGSSTSDTQVENGNMVLDSDLVVSDPEFANLEGNFDWNTVDLDLTRLLDPFTQSNKTIQHTSSSYWNQSTSTDQTLQIQQTISSPKISTPMLSTYTIRSLIQRPKLKIETQRIANLMLATLKSYPRMMKRKTTLPPFIHPSLIDSDDMEPLNNCISLVHMISSGVRGSRKLLWKNVRLECERLLQEYSRFNKWELLASLQALSIYILIRLDEGETDHNNFDFLLIATVTAISQQLANKKITGSIAHGPCTHDMEISWKDWIFEESIRRICVVYQVIDMLVYFEPATMCELPTELILAPLPSKKQLWEAHDEFMWKTEATMEPGVETTFGLASNGELVKLWSDSLHGDDATLLHKSVSSRNLPRDTANWEEWCSGMDGFGGLIMLAASLVA